MQPLSELRQDIVSGDWVVIARARARRPYDFLSQSREPFRQPKETCPFETLGDNAVFFSSTEGVPDKENWWVGVVPNKFPAFAPGDCTTTAKEGPYPWMQGTGSHEVVVTRDHEKSIADMTPPEAEAVIRTYRERFRVLAKDPCVHYVSVFQNSGRMAGATISHPHSQIISVPVVPPDVGRSIAGSQNYFSRNGECVHCVMAAYELKGKRRLIHENEKFVVFAPFASRSAFEIRIFPKSHNPDFGGLTDIESVFFAEAVRISLAKIARGLENPDYNFFIHTSPVKDVGRFSHYHWHLEIIPKTAIWAGFEIGTGIEISAIAPEDAAEFLRGIN